MSTPQSKLPIWNCQVEAPPQINVGTHFQINCSGEAVPLKTDQVMIYAKELDSQTQQASLNNLKILEVKNVNDHEIQAVATSYLVGKYEHDDFFVLTDGKNEVALQNLKFTVTSILQPNQENKPYPAYPPWAMSIPFWFIILIALLIIGPIAGILRIFIKQKQRRVLIESLKKLKTARLPFDEYHREIRILEKKYGVEPNDTKGYVADLEKAFRLYLVRELIVPANTWSDRAILKEIKSKHRVVWIENEKNLRRLLKEFERAKKSNVTVTDCRQLYLMSLEVSESIFKAVNAKNKRGAREF